MDVWTDEVLRDVLRDTRHRRRRALGRHAAALLAGLVAGVAAAWWVTGLEPLAPPAPEAPATVAARPPPPLPAALDALLSPALPAPLADAHAPFVDLLLEALPGARAAVPAPAGALARAAEPASERPNLIEDILAPGDTLARSLARHGIAASTVALIAREMRDEFDFRHARPGHRYALEQAADGTLLSFRYHVSDREHYEMVAGEDGWQTRGTTREVLRQQARLSGVVSTTLYDAVQDLGESPELASDFASIFAWDLDFAKSVRAGDAFHLLYERTYVRREGGGLRYVGPGRILAARYEGAAGTLEAVYYETEPGQGDYYRPNGESVRQHFLAAPLRYTRISSSFTQARFHPILRVTRPHPAIDYAAPVGTPVWAVASGRVSHVGRAGGFGRLVKIKHANGYESYYAHLSSYARGLRVGDRVSQKQVIGYVGQSGLATGPHLCFRIQKDGRYVNPASVRIPAGGSVPDDQRQDFVTVRDARLAQLGPSTLAATDEAM